MTTDNFYSDFEKSLREKYPYLEQLNKPLKLDYLLTKKDVVLPLSVLERAGEFVKHFFKLCHSNEYISRMNFVDSKVVQVQPPNYSLLMAYDFHYSHNSDTLKLIEVNTNASGYLFVSELYEFLNQDLPIHSKPLQTLANSFSEEIQLFYGKVKTPITIIDENIEKQNMYSEFLMYKSFLEQLEYKTEIADFASLEFKSNSSDSSKSELFLRNGEPCGFLYNRYCDFTLSESRSSHLRAAFVNKSNAFSPNPREYALLADKQRLTELTKPGALESFAHIADIDILKSMLLNSFEARSSSKNELWASRKKLFFKPLRSFGGKSSYRGSSISTKVFDRLFENNSLVQEYFPPEKLKYDDGEWKYDLRFYVYKDQIQNMAARIYKGQVTNFSTPHGGFACIRFK